MTGVQDRSAQIRIKATVQSVVRGDMSLEAACEDLLVTFGEHVIPELGILLQDHPHENTVMFVLWFIQRMQIQEGKGDRVIELIPQLVHQIKHPSRSVRNETLVILDQLDELWVHQYVDQLLAAFDDSDGSWRDRIIFALANANTTASAAIPRLRKLLENEATEATTRVAALRALAQIAPNNPDVLSDLEVWVDKTSSHHVALAIVYHVSEPSIDLKRKVTRVLDDRSGGSGYWRFSSNVINRVKQGGPWWDGMSEAVRAGIRDSESGVRAVAAAAVPKILGREEGMDRLAELLSTESDSDVLVATTSAIARYGTVPNRVLSRFREMMPTAEPKVKFALIAALGELSELDDESYTVLITAFSEGDMHIRAIAAFALVAHGSVDAEVLREVLRFVSPGAEPGYVYISPATMARAAPDLALPMIHYQLTSEDAIMRRAALASIMKARLQSERLLKQIIAIVQEDPFPVNRHAGILVLKQYPVSDDRIADVLRYASKMDPNPGVRNAAALGCPVMPMP